jgi:holliday junction DNA helicase RuvA
VIASVRGQVLTRRPDHVVVESAGVGYRLTVSAETLKAVPASGREVLLHSQLVVRDDSMQLFGFASEEERDLFLHLTSALASSCAPSPPVTRSASRPFPASASGPPSG